jgi:hypothetical protein
MSLPSTSESKRKETTDVVDAGAARESAVEQLSTEPSRSGVSEIRCTGAQGVLCGKSRHCVEVMDPPDAREDSEKFHPLSRTPGPCCDIHVVGRAAIRSRFVRLRRMA